MIKIRGLTKDYDKFRALDNINLNIKKGSFVAFLGPNGAGKTTLINILTTISQPTSGEILVNDENIKIDTNLIRNKLGVVFQESVLDNELTAYENLFIHARLYGIKDNIEKVIFDGLELVELNDFKDKKVSKFSGGMKRRLEIARSLIHNPEILILDEPTTGLDAQTRSKIWKYILNLNKSKEITVVLTTHYIQEAEMCDEVFILEKGKILEEGTVSDLIHKYSKNKVTIQTSNLVKCIELLEDFDLDCKIKNNSIVISSEKSLSNIFDILYREIETKIISIQISMSSLEESYLKITGTDLKDNYLKEV